VANNAFLLELFLANDTIHFFVLLSNFRGRSLLAVVCFSSPSMLANITLRGAKSNMNWRQVPHGERGASASPTMANVFGVLPASIALANAIRSAHTPTDEHDASTLAP
jgi:hypothetical protein